MKIQEKKVRVPITIVSDNNFEFDKKITEACEKYTIIEKHINIATILTGAQNGQGQIMALHCCYMVSLMTEEEKKSFEVRQTLQIAK